MTMWVHYCDCDRDWLWTGAGEDCNWCGLREPSPLSLGIQGRKRVTRAKFAATAVSSTSRNARPSRAESRQLRR